MPYRLPGLFAVPLLLGTIGSTVAAEAPSPDSKHTITIQLENDSTRPVSDSYYTNGFRIGYTSPTDQLPAPLASFGTSVLGEGRQRFTFELSQIVNTPLFTKLANPPANDRPYSAVLMGTFGIIHDTSAVRTALGLGLGVIGPAALGRQVQNGFHDLVGQGNVHGWATQIPNQPVIQLTAERTWRIALGRIALGRMPLGGMGGLEADILPSISAGAGTYRIYGQAGGTIRIGQGLQSDFGAPRIRPGLTGTDAYVAVLPLSWYVFAGADGQAVAWDETLDGLPFATSRHVTRSPLVGEFQAGVSVIAWGARLTAMHILQSNEFRSQRHGQFQFSSVSLSLKF